MAFGSESGDTVSAAVTIRNYTESMGDFYVATTKVKKFRNSYKLPVSRCYTGAVIEGESNLCDTVFPVGDTLTIHYNKELTMLLGEDFPLPDATVHESDRMKQGANPML